MTSTPWARRGRGHHVRYRRRSGDVWESLLPAQVLRLPGELARMEAVLDDPAFFTPFAPYFHLVIGRPSTPAECYLRLMFLKFRYRLGARACARRRATRSRGGGSARISATLRKLPRAHEGAFSGVAGCGQVRTETRGRFWILRVHPDYRPGFLRREPMITPIVTGQIATASVSLELIALR
jgi:transposase, IS5 family